MQIQKHNVGGLKHKELSKHVKTYACSHNDIKIVIQAHRLSFE